MIGLLQVDISDHKVLPGVKRKIIVDSFWPVDSRKELTITVYAKYFKDGQDISELIAQPKNCKLYTNNEKLLWKRSWPTFAPIPNPDWVPEYSAEDLATLTPTNLEDALIWITPEPRQVEVEGWTPEYDPENPEVITNEADRYTMVYDPIYSEPNPDYVPEYSEEDLATLTPSNWYFQNQTEPAFDSIIQYIYKEVAIAEIIRAYILENDADGFFD